MGMPHIPQKCREEAINDLLESIALEEAAIAHIMNAEGEKIQKVLDCTFPHPTSFQQILELQNSVTELFEKLIQKQNTLVSKMKIIKKIIYYEDGHHEHHNNIPICNDEE